MRRTTLVFLLVIGTANVLHAEDSIYVALAKRTNRKASKSIVITNETVSASKGRLSAPAGTPDAAGQAATTTPPPASVATRSTQTEPKPQTMQAPPAAAPAYSSTEPATTARFIDPPSSARTVVPTITIRTIEPASGARTVEPSSTARTIQPESSARNVPVQPSNPPN